MLFFYSLVMTFLLPASGSQYWKQNAVPEQGYQELQGVKYERMMYVAENYVNQETSGG